MQPGSLKTGKIPFFGKTPDEFDALVKEWGWPAFRGKQVRDWVYRKGVADPGLMSNLSKSDRDKLGERVEFATAVTTRRQDASDGTIKLLLTWPDGNNAETVMIP